MPASYDTTTLPGVRILEGSSPIEFIDEGFEAMAVDLTGIMDDRKAVTGQAVASSDLGLTTSVADVPGASLSVAPAVASVALAIATFDFRLVLTSNDDPSLTGYLSVDAAHQSPLATFRATHLSGEANRTTRATVSQTFVVPLAAGSHTLKLRAATSATALGSTHAMAANTTLSVVTFAT